MIVEVFKKGTTPAFSEFINIYFGVTSITVNGGEYVLTMESRPNAVINAREYEFKVSY